MFYLNNPSISSGQVTAKGCFWCNEIIPGSIGNCTIRERPQGGYYLARDAQIRVRRFFIGWSTQNVEIPCSPDEYFEDL